MINKICFAAPWLEQKRRQLKPDPYLLERALHAFALLGQLAESGLDFVFKGGTSLLLYVPVNQYRGGGFTHVQALDDTLDAALHLSKHSLKGVANTPEAGKMAEGVRKVSEHLINYRFNLNVAKVAAAKAALLSRLVLSEGRNDSLAYWRTLPTVAEMSALTIDGPWERLQRLRSTSPEAFFYWQQTAKLQAMLEGF